MQTTLIVAIISVSIAFLGFALQVHKEIKLKEREQTKVLMNMEIIQNNCLVSCLRIEKEIEQMKIERQRDHDLIIIVEQMAKSAHKRLDEK